MTDIPQDLAVYFQDVSIRFRAPEEHFVTFKDYMIKWMQGKVKHSEFWALTDVSLDIRRGEVFGIIGHNGAGKSTMLKVVARVLRPTKGRVVVRGRVVPLLELGAGFHPELSGRENIFLNGAILGYSRQEMEKKFQRIVDFAELGDFIESPVRTYSSGMWARLGFAVATDELPDLLLVDEILAVGDEAFQRKCLARIKNFRDQGASILIVAHSMDLIRSMCQRVAWMDHGHVKAIGEPDEVIALYRASQK